jgi:hypothetical protein
MPVKDAFSAEEWDRIVLAPMLAAFAVTAADPSGMIGVIRESSAAARAMEAARYDDDAFTTEVIDVYASDEAREAAQDAISAIARGREPAEATAEALSRIAEVSRLLDREGIEAGRFRDWLRDIGLAVAEATREGGFLGFGGERVSEAERRALSDLDAALASAPG